MHAMALQERGGLWLYERRGGGEECSLMHATALQEGGVRF